MKRKYLLSKKKNAQIITLTEPQRQKVRFLTLRLNYLMNLYCL